MTRTATIRQCAILAGGLGTPQPVGGRPFLGWLMREVSRFGVEEVVILTGHRSDVVRRAVEESAATLPRPLSIVFCEAPVRAGTGGALLHARHLLDARFLLLNGDSLLDFNLAAMLAAGARDDEEVLARIAVREVADAGRHGAVRQEGAINGGVYLIDRRLVARASAVCSLEQDIFPALAAEGRLRASRAEGYFIDTGIPADLARAQTELPRALRRPALLLDRDGTINIDHGWVGSQARWEWMPGAQKAVAAATAAGWHVFVVTNQSGIARGLYSEAEMHGLHRFMAEAMRAAGGTVDDIRFCPYHPEAKLAAFRRVSDWRKPGPGMILDLIRAWELEPGACVMVGDQPTDMQAAAAAGVAGHLFGGGDLAAFVAPLLEAVRR